MYWSDANSSPFIRHIRFTSNPFCRSSKQPFGALARSSLFLVVWVRVIWQQNIADVPLLWVLQRKDSMFTGQGEKGEIEV